MEGTPIIVSPPKPRPPFWKRLVKRLFVIALAGFGLIFLTSIIIAAFFEDEIGKQLLGEINKQLKTELRIEEFDLSLLSGFPNVSANLKGVVLEDAMKGNLLEAQNISFRFGLLSLLGSKVKVNSVVISDGALFVKKDRKGRTNYDIQKAPEKEADPTEDTSSDLGISIEEASFEDVELIYVDERAKHEMKVQLKEAVLSGEFSSRKFELNSFAELKSDFIEFERDRFLVGKDLVYDAKIKVDLENGIYEFEEVDIGVAANLFKIDGTIKIKGVNTDYDLVITGKDGSIESVLGLLPEQYQNYFEDFKSKGNFLFSTAIKGRLNARQTPSIRAKFSLRDGQINSSKLAKSLKDVTFTARFSNGKNNNNQTSVFEISDFKGYFNRELIELGLKVNNLDNPTIDFKLDGVMPMASVYGLFNSPMITDGEGEIEIQDLQIKGRYRDMINPNRIGKVSTSGIVEFDDAGLTINNEDIVLDKGSVRFRGNSLMVDNIKVEGAGSELMLNGKFLNLLPVIFADAENSKKAELRFQAKLDASELDIDRLVKMTTVQVEEGQVQKAVYDSLKVAQTQKREYFTNFLKGTFQAKIDQFNYHKINGEEFSGELEFDHSELHIKGTTLAMNGRLNLDGTAFFKEEPYLRSRLIFDGIDVKEFFRQAENFGQEVLIYNNVKGTLDAKLAIQAFWDAEGQYQDDKLRVLGDVSISDGELINFDLLYDFSNYIKIRDLRHIKFTNMRNWLEVRKGRIHIPAMFIQSNALNMTISGQHTFENDIDYSIKVNAGQVLWNKLKKHNPNRKPQPAKKKGWFNLYYRIHGTVEDYITKSDKRHAKKQFRLSENRKKEIQAALIKEFGRKNIATADEPDDWIDEGETPGKAVVNDKDEEFLDFEVESKPQQEEEEEYMWEEEGGS